MPLRRPKPLRHKPPPELIYIDDALVVKNSMDAELKGKKEDGLSIMLKNGEVVDFKKTLLNQQKSGKSIL